MTAILLSFVIALALNGAVRRLFGLSMDWYLPPSLDWIPTASLHHAHGGAALDAPPDPAAD